MSESAGRILFGFIAAALAVITVHQGMVWLLTQFGWIKGTPWSFNGIAPFNVPQILNSIFWGGLWGALFGVIHERLPGGSAAIKGLIYGLSIAVLSNWLLLPFIKGTVFGQANQVFFAGFEPQRMASTLLILGIFGVVTAMIYQALRREA